MEAFVIIFSLAWGILSLILFFKIWGMTNDMRVIKELLIEHLDSYVMDDETDFDKEADTDEEEVADDVAAKGNEEKHEYIDVSSSFSTSNKKVAQYIHKVEDYVNNALQSGLDKEQIQSGIEYVAQENKSLLKSTGKDPLAVAKKVASKIIETYNDNHKV